MRPLYGKGRGVSHCATRHRIVSLPVKRWKSRSNHRRFRRMSDKNPVNPPAPASRAPTVMPLLAGFPPTLVGFRTSTPIKEPPLATKGPSKAHVTIAAELCKGCELCVLACPSGNLTLSDQLNRNGYHPVVFTYEGSRGPCSACGICYWVCPDFSISEIRRIRQ